MQVAQLAQLAGRVLERAGMYTRAVKLHQKCIGLRMSELGYSHPDVATALNNLGFSHYEAGDYHAAKQALQDAIDMRRELLGAQHCLVAAPLHNMALLRMAEGDKEEAESLLRQALAIREAALGPSNEKVAASLNVIGRLMVERGEYDGAEAIYTRTLGIFRACLGADHPFTAASMYYLAEISMYRGWLGQAESGFREARELWETALGPNHPYVATCLSKLAEVLQVREKYDEAEQLLTSSLRRMDMLLGADHPDLLGILVGLAEVQIQLRQTQNAEALLQRCETICRESFGEAAASNEMMLEAGRMRGILAMMAGDSARARAMFGQVAAQWGAGTRVCDFRCAALYSDMSMLEYSCGDMKAAKMYLQRALLLSQNSAARDHPTILKSLKALAGALEKADVHLPLWGQRSSKHARRSMEQTLGLLMGRANRNTLKRDQHTATSTGLVLPVSVEAEVGASPPHRLQRLVSGALASVSCWGRAAVAEPMRLSPHANGN